MLLALRDGSRLDGDDAALAVRGSPAVAAALRRLAGQGAPEDELIADVLAEEGPPGAARLGFYLHGLGRHGLLQRSAWSVGRRLATLVPAPPRFAAPPIEEGRYVLSRFAYLHADGGRAIL